MTTKQTKKGREGDNEKVFLPRRHVVTSTHLHVFTLRLLSAASRPLLPTGGGSVRQLQVHISTRLLEIWQALMCERQPVL